ncbi:DUF7289 family protein [Haloglomus litoreum]|uniref:DUF7289 family protein n=1 Tax=Haloglomus litoreum TaxID=3034026 RepID=UPI0023E80740|nr:hypothetical protein [Haloglomus sp. DT116]
MRTLDAEAERAVTQVVGVAVLLGLTVVSLGVLTAGIGTVVEENAASADAARVADGLSTGLEPVERTGRSRESLAFTDGRVTTVERDLRVIDGTRTVKRLEADALVWTGGGGRVAYVAGAVVRGEPGRADLRAPPPITASRDAADGGVLVVGAPRLGSDAGRTVTAGGGTTVPLRTNVSHERTDLGVSRFRVAIETTTPGALAPYFREQGATVSRRDIDGDGVPSVVATYPGQRRAYLVVHDLNLSVGTDPATTPSPSASPTPSPTPTPGDDSSDDGSDADDGLDLPDILPDGPFGGHDGDSDDESEDADRGTDDADDKGGQDGAGGDWLDSFFDHSQLTMRRASPGSTTFEGGDGP